MAAEQCPGGLGHTPQLAEGNAAPVSERMKGDDRKATAALSRGTLSKEQVGLSIGLLYDGWVDGLLGEQGERLET